MTAFDQVISDNRPRRQFVKLSEIAKAVVQEKFSLRKTVTTPKVSSGSAALLMKTGIAPLDQMLPSLEAGKLYVLGGRPGMGKTALLLQIAVNIAASTSRPVYMLSPELSAERLFLRTLSQLAGIDLTAVSSGTLTDRRKELMALCWSIMDALPIYICDRAVPIDKGSCFAANEITGGTLMIDYLQLIDADMKKPRGVSCFLKRLAQEKEIPVVVCSQLSRNLEQRANKRPALQDLGHTTEQDADVILFLYRDAYYANDGGEDTELILAKNRGGQTGTAYVRFNRRRIIFESK